MKGKKLLAGLLSAAMVFGSVSFTAFADGEENQTETSTSTTENSATAWYDNNKDATVFTISTADELVGLASIVNNEIDNFYKKTIVLGNDIDMSDIGKWTPIGVGNYFEGTFDGQNHTISNFTSNSDGFSKGYCNGFFGNMRSASEIKNVTFDNAHVECIFNFRGSNGGNVFGIVAAYTYGNNALFENITVKNSYIRGFGKIGGIIGMAADPGATTIVKDCAVYDTTICASYDGAGIIGLGQGNIVMSGNRVSNIEYVPDPNEKYADVDLEVACENVSAPSCPGKGTKAKGWYWIKQGCYWGGYADFYTQYGHSSHDCALVGENLLLANSEIVHDAVAEIDGVKYLTLADAIAAANPGDTVILTADLTEGAASADTITLASNNDPVVYDLSNITLDLNEKTYTAPNFSHVFTGENATIKNGKMVCADNGSYALFIGDDNVTDNFVAENIELTGGVNVYNAKNVILRDLTVNGTDYYAVWADNYGEVTIESGKYTAGEKGLFNAESEENGAKIDVKGGTFVDNGKPVMPEGNGNLNIYGGSFNVDVSKYCPTGYSPKLVNGVYVVSNVTDTIDLKFEKQNGTDNVYDIVLSGGEENINRLNAAEFTFKLDVTKGDLAYEIAAADKMSLITKANAENYYEFHFDGKDFAKGTADSGSTITIGTVTFDGYGEFTFGAKEGKVTATTENDNLVTEFVTTSETGKGTLNIKKNENKIDGNITVPTQTLTINVAMNHKVTDNTADYQDMTVEISGGDLGKDTKVFKLGNDGTEGTVALASNGVYTIKADLTQNRLYTVTVKGAGYRTARYTVNMNADKTMNFWNNVMTSDVTVVDDVAAKKNFLAGDIVKDGVINIYDLSAVVAYFGADNLPTTNKAYAKYDINRDGKIDMMDISIVLTSWGE